jgi:surfactin synthase thioesterase subunit
MFISQILLLFLLFRSDLSLVDWRDNARDILNFLLYYLPESPTGESLPTHLDRLRPAQTDQRRTSAFKHRTLAVVGHSFGGCTAYDDDFLRHFFRLTFPLVR